MFKKQGGGEEINYGYLHYISLISYSDVHGGHRSRFVISLAFNHLIKQEFIWFPLLGVTMS